MFYSVYFCWIYTPWRPPTFMMCIVWLFRKPWFPLSGVRSTPSNIFFASSLITNLNNAILKFFLKSLSQITIEIYPRFFESFPVSGIGDCSLYNITKVGDFTYFVHLTSHRLRVVGFCSWNPRRVELLILCKFRERNEEGMGRGRKKTDYGGFFVIQIPVPEKRKIPIG